MMAKTFCECGRLHYFEDKAGVTYICACGRVLEPMTEAQFQITSQAHNETLIRMAKAIAGADDFEPCVRLFR